MPLVIISNRRQIVFDSSSDVPTVPTARTHDEPSWLSSDIYRGEFAVNLRSQKVYTRTDFGIIELMTSANLPIYIGPEVYAGGTSSYQNDSLISADENKTILFVDDLLFPLIGASKKATLDNVLGQINLDGFQFNKNTCIFIIIKP